ncbi:MAG: adenylosuccinate synthase, partial [Atribacterota bacterium]|nr:adenylosuccinate synthase [Atribacterota bacterium]
LSESADVVARAQGGSNAGHTVIVDGEKFVFHLIPSGILHQDKICVLGDGMVIDPVSFLKEVDILSRQGVCVERRLIVSPRAHLVMPYHRILDELYERLRGKGRIGTTGRGIGPAYEDKVARWGIRVGDLLDEEFFAERLKAVLDYKNLLLERVFNHPPLSFTEIFSEYLNHAKAMLPYVADVSLLLARNLQEGKKILLEGAQGTMLDLEHGTYPFVTSSYPVASGALLGVGMGPSSDIEVLGVCKAYTSRVGEGPFPTELKDETGVYLREKGKEYGATTGRPRRCGWLDGVALRYAVRVNHITSLALTKLDVLRGLPRIRICYAYEIGEKVTQEFPFDLHSLSRCLPLYRDLPGWEEDIAMVREYAELPSAVRRFVEEIEDLVEVPVSIISVGPGRGDTIVRKTLW